MYSVTIFVDRVMEKFTVYADTVDDAHKAVLTRMKDEGRVCGKVVNIRRLW